MKRQLCEKCGYDLEAATSVEANGVAPVAGDISICLRCGNVGQFDQCGNVRWMTSEEVRTMKETKPNLAKILNRVEAGRRMMGW